MSSHLLQHLPSCRSRAAFQASPGTMDRERWDALHGTGKEPPLDTMLSAHRSLSTSTTNHREYWNNSSSALQEEASAQGNNPSSSFKSLPELARRWTWCFCSHTGCCDYTLQFHMHNMKTDYLLYSWERQILVTLGKGTVTWSLLSWQTSSPLVFPHLTQTFLRKLMDMAHSSAHFHKQLYQVVKLYPYRLHNQAGVSLAPVAGRLGGQREL